MLRELRAFLSSMISRKRSKPLDYPSGLLDPRPAREAIMEPLKLQVTLWPSFPHFPRFAKDKRLQGIRLNSAMIDVKELEMELEGIDPTKAPVPLYFDIKGRQLRIHEVIPNDKRLEFVLNHPIEVETPVMVLFKAGADGALLEEVKDGRHLIFHGGPKFKVRAGESLHIRDKSLKVLGPQFTDMELKKIEMVVAAGFKHYYLSYVENQADVDEFRSYIGDDSELRLKIENKRGLRYVANEFKPSDNTSLVAARGDLYVEVNQPHDIIKALKLIISKDPRACVGSRLLLSVIRGPVPECHDFSDLAWLYDIGFRDMLLCDELCLKEDLLGTAINVFDAFRMEYANDRVPSGSPAGKRGLHSVHGPILRSRKGDAGSTG